MHVNTGHDHLREKIPAAAGGSAQTRRERPKSTGAPKICNSYDVSMRDPHCDERPSHGNLAYVMLCYTLVLWGWSVVNPGVSSGGTSNSTILPQWYRTGPGHDLVGIALDPTSFLCSSRRWEGWNGGASDIVKVESSGKDPRATGGLVSNLPHPRVNKTKQHWTHAQT